MREGCAGWEKCFADLEAFLVNGLSWVEIIYMILRRPVFFLGWVGLVWLLCSSCRVDWIVWFLIAPGLLHNLRTEVC